MAKQTSSKPSSSAPKRKPTSEAPGPITRVTPKVEAKAAAQPAPKTEAPTGADLKSAPSHEQIAQRAYELYRTRPQHDGNELHDWLRAEDDLRA